MELTREVISLLSPPERLAWIEQLWDSLDDTDIPHTTAQAEELDSRLAAHEASPEEGVSWADLKSEC